MAKLHELLAAESSVSAAHNAIADETLKVFGKPDHFLKETRSVNHFDDADKKLDTSATKDAVTTVDERLSYSLGRSFTSYFDLLVQKDRTNQEARANVVVNGAVLLADVPATALLTLETKLGELRKQFAAIPTLQPGPVWVHDAGEDRWRTAEPKVSHQTKKTIRPIVLVAATDRHPAQVDKIAEDVPVAKIEVTTWSGMWTSVQKHNALARLDALLVAVKKARQRANRTDVVDIKVGAKISDFLLRGPASEALTGSDTE